VLRVGLTGGIGAGKSEVSRRLAGQGAVLIDADAIAREVVEPGTPGLAAVVEAFGDRVLLPGGGLDRSRLGDVVFTDPASLARLNEIMHPLIGQRMTELERSAGSGAIVVHDVPLLAEHNLGFGYDVVVVVDAPEQLQLERLTGTRKMTREQAEARMAAQASREQRLAIADLVIDNSGSLAALGTRVDEVWGELQRRNRPERAR
jgi:dephospho-CoA kinase